MEPPSQDPPSAKEAICSEESSILIQLGRQTELIPHFLKVLALKPLQEDKLPMDAAAVVPCHLDISLRNLASYIFSIR